MVFLNIKFPHYLHLQRVQVDIQWQQIKGEILDVDKLHQVGTFQELFGSHGALRPENGVEFPSGRFLYIHHDQIS